MRKMLFGMAASLLLASTSTRADDGDAADQKVAADRMKLKDDIKAVNAEKTKVKAAHEQVVDDRQQLAKDRAAHDGTAVAADKAKLASDLTTLKDDFKQSRRTRSSGARIAAS